MAIYTGTISQNLERAASDPKQFRDVLKSWMIANANVFEYERASIKAIFSPARQPMLHGILQRTLVEMQRNGSFLPDFDVSFSADGDRFSLIKATFKTIKNEKPVQID